MDKTNKILVGIIIIILVLIAVTSLIPHGAFSRGSHNRTSRRDLGASVYDSGNNYYNGYTATVPYFNYNNTRSQEYYPTYFPYSYTSSTMTPSTQYYSTVTTTAQPYTMTITCTYNQYGVCQ